MPTTLLIVYRVLGTVLFALATAAIVEKYRTVRGAVLLPARVLECRRASSTSNSRGAGGYRYLVELYANGRRLELETKAEGTTGKDSQGGTPLCCWKELSFQHNPLWLDKQEERTKPKEETI